MGLDGSDNPLNKRRTALDAVQMMKIRSWLISRQKNKASETSSPSKFLEVIWGQKAETITFAKLVV